ncbi:hypothetical protein XPA_001903 [Xanthoria parietina]
MSRLMRVTSAADGKVQLRLTQGAGPMSSSEVPGTGFVARPENILTHAPSTGGIVVFPNDNIGLHRSVPDVMVLNRSVKPMPALAKTTSTIALFHQRNGLQKGQYQQHLHKPEASSSTAGQDSTHMWRPVLELAVRPERLLSLLSSSSRSSAPGTGCVSSSPDQSKPTEHTGRSSASSKTSKKLPLPVRALDTSTP